MFYAFFLDNNAMVVSVMTRVQFLEASLSKLEFLKYKTASALAVRQNFFICSVKMSFQPFKSVIMYNLIHTFFSSSMSVLIS